MSESVGLLKKFDKCDLVVLTPVSKDRTYCRFFLDGLYQDRMFVSGPLLLARLHQLVGEGQVINGSGIARLKQAAMGEGKS